MGRQHAAAVSDEIIAAENGVDWRIFNVAMSGRLHDSLSEIEERWTFDRFHRAEVAVMLAIVAETEARRGG